MWTKYFHSYQDYFWQWEDHGEIIAIPGGNTVAYKALVASIVEKTASQGLPPFGSLLLVLIALNPSGNHDINEVRKILGKNPEIIGGGLPTEVTYFLQMLASVPDNYKTSEGKVQLIRAIFENCHGIISLKDSSKIASNFRDSTHHSLNDERKPLIFSRFKRDFRTLEILSKKYTNTKDVLKKIADLPELEEELNIEEETNSEPKDWLTELTEEPKTFQIASLIKTLWAGLNLPFKSSVPSEQPIGGVSDLTNKGNYDQLLISEYANDDLVFLSRLANNEALYLSRETPPSSNNFKRIILIDVSLKSWGTPKTINYAIALALAKSPKAEDIEFEVFAVGNSLYPINLDSLDNTIKSIQRVEASLDCSAGLEEYFTTNSTSKNNEVFVLTEKTAFQENGILKFDNEHGEHINYWIFSDSEGSIDVYKRLKSSKKHTQHIELPLNRLWTKKKKPQAKRKEKESDTYPILFNKPKAKLGIRIDQHENLYSINHEGALLRFFDKHKRSHEKGWEIICEETPTSISNYTVGVSSKKEVLLLLFSSQNKELILFNVSTKKQKTIEFRELGPDNSLSIIFYNNKFYCKTSLGCWRINTKGEIYVVIVDMNSIFDSFIQNQDKRKQEFKTTHGVYKNIDNVGINSDNNLILDGHEFLKNRGGHIKLGLSKNKAHIITATKIEPSIFQFADNSQVIINRSGLIILKSSDSNIPTIYIPSVLNSTLGIATEEEFTGNKYYFIEPQYKINLDDVGASRITIVKLIKTYCMVSLSEAYRMVDIGYVLLPPKFIKQEIEKISEELQLAGATVSIKSLGNTNQKEVEPKAFFENYITPFIDTILSHGA